MNNIIRKETFFVIDTNQLPHDVRDSIIDECPRNDSFSLIYPDKEYYPIFTKWLKKNNFNEEKYLLEWSW